MNYIPLILLELKVDKILYSLDILDELITMERIRVIFVRFFKIHIIYFFGIRNINRSNIIFSFCFE